MSKNFLRKPLAAGLALLFIQGASAPGPWPVARSEKAPFCSQALLPPATQFRAPLAQFARLAALTPLIATVLVHVWFSDRTNRPALQKPRNEWRAFRLSVGWWIYRHSALNRIVAIEGAENLLLSQGAVIAASHINTFGVDGFLMNFAILLITGRWVTFVVARSFKDPWMQALSTLMIATGLAIPTDALESLRDLRKLVSAHKATANGAPHKSYAADGLTQQITKWIGRGRLVAIFAAGYGGQNRARRWSTSFAHAVYNTTLEGTAAGLPVLPAAVVSETGFPVEAQIPNVFRWLKANYATFTVDRPALRVIFGSPLQSPPGQERPSATHDLYERTLDFVNSHTPSALPKPVLPAAAHGVRRSA